MSWTAIYLSGNYEVTWVSSKWWSNISNILACLRTCLFGHICVACSGQPLITRETMRLSGVSSKWWSNISNILACLRTCLFGHICVTYLKVQAFNLHLHWNKSRNIDTSVCFWASPHLKLFLQVNESVPFFLYLFYICWFINFFIIFCHFCGQFKR